MADATGPVSEPRRHFFFVLTSAFACALVAVAFTLWFRHLGQTPAVAVGWALLGIVATPCWFYGTSTFDDILGTAGLVWAVVVAYLSRERRPLLGAAAAGLLLGWTFNCKEPLGICRPDRAGRESRLAAAVATAMGPRRFDPRRSGAGPDHLSSLRTLQIPSRIDGRHEELWQRYVPIWTANPLPALAAWTLSPGAGVFWYCPPLLLCLVGLYRWRAPKASRLCRAVLVSCAIFLGFLSFLTFFNGDPAWGPRYLTPVFALLWLFARQGSRR